MTEANAWRARRAVDPGKPWAEPTLDDILAGAVVRATMSADRVDADALSAMLRAVASRLRGPVRASRAVTRPQAPLRARAFTAGCQPPAGPAGAEIELVRADG